MNEKSEYLIIGNGIAGISAAVTLRNKDNEGKITVVTKSPKPFYYRIRLVEYLAGKTEFEKLIAYGEGFYLDKNIEVKLDTEVTDIDSENKKVTFEDGSSMEYNKLLLATGARPRYPDIKGIKEKKWVLKFRGVNDSDEIANHVEICEKVAVLGGGLLGIETAFSLFNLGKNVTVIETAPRLLPRQLDEEGSRILQKILEEKGINFILGKNVEEILGEDCVEGIRFDDGEIFEVKSLVLSAGITPRLELAESAGVEVNRGIVVNEYMETSIKDIYAAGDSIEFQGTLYGLWIPAKEQGDVAGSNMAGEKSKYNPISSETRLKVSGISFFSGGDIEPMGANIYKYNKDGIYRKFFVRDEKIVGAILLGDPKTSMKAGGFIKNRESTDVIYGLYE
ncbi:FAD-dependent oxidoreductase [uncultured Ilyobacter sp.]|uniref:NAD(P)/FAD-dependent oxidoreductase n=1 Tax=uncultured Ilyobacter sp. TaxID=544433 RepID=UPI0029C7DE66|nr:FAD-dependent oxidoreductase [uncultured Ilyobacter sp.]